jgi:hypothetical protein
MGSGSFFLLLCLSVEEKNIFTTEMCLQSQERENDGIQSLIVYSINVEYKWNIKKNKVKESRNIIID